ncbi:MAG: HD domain-containing protein [Nitrosomonadales bacterium]|nr:HD domain-containing protein [Nitrosomonadales bacterium]
MFTHNDSLDGLDSNVALGKKLAVIHETIRASYPFISRIAAALYDEKTDILKTFVYSSTENQPLVHYQAKLGEASSLLEIVRLKRPRVVNDLGIFDQGQHEHTHRIREQGYSSSYTMPMYARGTLFGFLFFNSSEAAPFTEEVLRQLDPYGHLIALTIINDLASVQTLLATVKTARDMGHLRDDETGAHQDRMSRYARLIARKIAPKHGFSDEHIENLFVFSVLHDIGKMGVPDGILLKPSGLTEDEFTQMKSHTIKGRKLIDQLVENFDFGTLPHIAVLRNIAELHHEAMDGSGYPNGHKGEEIPIEARITSVADVFDALTSRRPYKEAWSNDEAFAMIQRLSGVKFDPDCVQALIDGRAEIEEIQRQFREDVVG